MQIGDSLHASTSQLSFKVRPWQPLFEPPRCVTDTGATLLIIHPHLTLHSSPTHTATNQSIEIRTGMLPQTLIAKARVGDVTLHNYNARVAVQWVHSGKPCLYVKL